MAEPAAKRPSRFPGGFRRGNNGSDNPPPPQDNNADYIAGRENGSGKNSGVSPQSVVFSGRSNAGDAYGGGGGGGKIPLQERLQAAPTLIREKAVDLREDVHDRVLDIRVRTMERSSSIAVQLRP